MHPDARHPRTALRSLLACLEIVGFAAGAHVVAGGHLPGPVFLLALAAVVGGAAHLSISRRSSPVVVVPFVLAAQVGLHATLEASSHVHTGMVMHQPEHGFLGLTPTMLWAHVVTTLLTAIVLLCQERLVSAVTTYLRPLVAVVVPAGQQRPPYAAPSVGVRRILLATSPRRGPPALVLATS